MTRSMFEMGFRSSWGLQPAPAPALGSAFSDIQDWWKSHYGEAKDIVDRTKLPTTTVPATVPPPAAPGTIFGLPQKTVIVGGAVLVGAAVLIAVLAGSH